MTVYPAIPPHRRAYMQEFVDTPPQASTPSKLRRITLDRILSNTPLPSDGFASAREIWEKDGIGAPLSVAVALRELEALGEVTSYLSPRADGQQSTRLWARVVR